MSRLDEIRGRLARSSSKPWRVSHVYTNDDAEFIANAPEDVAYLLAEVDRLRLGWENSAAGHEITARIAGNALDLAKGLADQLRDLE